MKRWNSGFKVFAMLLSVLLICPATILCAAATPASSAKIKHKVPGEKYIPGFRINLDVEITDKTGLMATRCYFKTKNDKNFAFVDLFHTDGANYKATLPAPFVNSEAVNYLFVVVNKNKQVSRTQTFTIEEGETKEATTWKDINEVKEVRLDQVQDIAEKYIALYDGAKNNYADTIPSYQETTSDMALKVKTELPRKLVPLNGFYDIATVTAVAAAAKYGFLAENLYSTDAIASGGGTAATGATSAGTIAASTGGLSTTAILGIAGVAIAGGIAVAAGGSSGGGSGGGSTPTPVTPTPTPTPTPSPTLDQSTILGNWNYAGTRFDGVARSGNMTFNAGGSTAYFMSDADGQVNQSGTGTWTLSGTNLTVTFDTLSTWNGTVTGDDSEFTFSNTGHGTYNFTR